MILLVGSEQLEKMWTLMEPGLARAEYPDDLGSVWTMEDLYKDLATGEAHGFYQVESQYAGVLTTLTYPTKTILYVYWGGKHPDNKVELDYEELDRFLVDVAKTFGANVIKVQGRHGWARKTKHLGYSPETISLYKEVLYE